MERTNVFLGSEDRERIEVIRQRYGLASAGAAIRLAIKLAVPDTIEAPPSPQRPKRRRRRASQSEEGQE